MEPICPPEQSSARRIHSPMARGVHRYPSHPRVLFIHSREAKFVTADVSRALFTWPLIGSLLTIFGTACFVLLSPGEQVFDFRAAAASLLPLWRILASVVLLASVLMLLNVTADMASVSWTS